MVPWERLTVACHHVMLHKQDHNWKVVNRTNPFSALWYLYEGEARFQIGEKEIGASAGDVLILPAGQTFHARLLPSCRRISNFAARFTLYAGDSMDWFKLYQMPVVIHKDEHPIREDDLEELIHWSHTHTPMRQFFMDHALLRLVGLLMEARLQEVTPTFHPDHPLHDRLYHVLQWVRSHLHEKITLAKLAEMIHVSEDHFIDLFQRYTGKSPIQYVNHLRIEKAKAYLLNHHFSVKETAYAVGIRDPLYFSKMFKKQVGQSPAYYRKMMSDW
ncbi:helix-turn-helix domain-containing protein [Marinicrinis sediminis]|uniref:Helix-turn-helix domain-containing protein n=1 Tax=Marinicrinis sediminis TaxID=1652465 RepID=A0ABW5R840_9BACL